jgi:hypothetical protein
MGAGPLLMRAHPFALFVAAKGLALLRADAEVLAQQP